MGTILETVERLIDIYDQGQLEDDAADGVTVGMVLMKDMYHALGRICQRICGTCGGDGFVANPTARYSMDYCAGRATGVYSTNDPEEIDCPECFGIGFQPLPRRPAPEPRPAQVERDDGMPF